MEIEKQLRIKVNVIKRLEKDVHSYRAEAETQQKRIDALIAAHADDADVRKQREVKQETINTIPDVVARLHRAVEDLTLFIEENNDGDNNNNNNNNNGDGNSDALAGAFKQARELVATITESLSSM